MPDGLTILLISVRAKIRDGLDGYSANDDYWLRCLYEGENGDPEDVETGFLKSALLVKVSCSYLVLIPVYAPDPVLIFHVRRPSRRYLHHLHLRRGISTRPWPLTSQQSLNLTQSVEKWFQNAQPLQFSSKWMVK